MNRREFLQLTGAALAGAAISRLVPPKKEQDIDGLWIPNNHNPNLLVWTTNSTDPVSFEPIVCKKIQLGKQYAFFVPNQWDINDNCNSNKSIYRVYYRESVDNADDVSTEDSNTRRGCNYYDSGAPVETPTIIFTNVVGDIYSAEADTHWRKFTYSVNNLYKEKDFTKYPDNRQLVGGLWYLFKPVAITKGLPSFTVYPYNAKSDRLPSTKLLSTPNN